jgi:hypothetical protein
VFRLNWVFDTKLTLEGESTTYRIAVIRGVMGKAGVETGLRRTYTLNKAAPPEDQAEGVEAEPEPVKESEPMVEETETPTEETPPVEEEIPPSEEPPAEDASPLEETAAEEVPAAEEPPVIEEVPVEEEVVETEEPITEEPVPESESEPEPEPEEEVIPPEEEKVMDFKMEFNPETPVFVEQNQPLVGTLFGFEPNEPLHVTIEKSTSEENGWILWTERNVRLDGERTPATLIPTLDL